MEPTDIRLPDTYSCLPTAAEATGRETGDGNMVSSIEEVPDIIRENYTIKTYEEATGKRAPGKYYVTLSKPENEKAIIILFILERAWSISKISPEEKLEEKEQITEKTKTTKKEVDTGQVWACPICGKNHRLIHVETEKTVKHQLRKPLS